MMDTIMLAAHEIYGTLLRQECVFSPKLIWRHKKLLLY